MRSSCVACFVDAAPEETISARIFLIPNKIKHINFSLSPLVFAFYFHPQKHIRNPVDRFVLIILYNRQKEKKDNQMGLLSILRKVRRG